MSPVERDPNRIGIRERIAGLADTAHLIANDIRSGNMNFATLGAIVGIGGAAVGGAVGVQEAQGKTGSSEIKISQLDRNSEEYTSAKARLEADPMRTTPWAGNPGSGIGPNVKQDYASICEGTSRREEEPILTWDFNRRSTLKFDYLPKTDKYCDLMGTSTQKIKVQIGKAGKRRAGGFKDAGVVFEHEDSTDEQLPYYGLNDLVIDGKLILNKKVCTGPKRNRILMRLVMEKERQPKLDQTFQNTVYNGVELNSPVKSKSYTSPRFACVPKSRLKTRDYVPGQ